MEVESNIVDDQGTDQGDAQEMLKAFRDNGFDGDDERTGLVLGRPPTEIRDMVAGDVDIDDDLVMKIRGMQKNGACRSADRREANNGGTRSTQPHRSRMFRFANRTATRFLNVTL